MKKYLSKNANLSEKVKNVKEKVKNVNQPLITQLPEGPDQENPAMDGSSWVTPECPHVSDITLIG